MAVSALPENLGQYPESGPVSRDRKLFYKLSDDSAIKMISGKKTPALINVWASNDVIQFGNIKILSGGPGPQQTEYDKHPGDAAFYALEGNVTFYLPDTKDTYDAAQGDFMFIPAGTKYKIINYTGKSVNAPRPSLSAMDVASPLVRLSVTA